MKLTVNGQVHEVDVEDNMPLLWVLRDELGMTGTKYGCGIAQCGACTVHLNGTAVRSCQLPASAAAQSEITTIEGLSDQASTPTNNQTSDQTNDQANGQAGNQAGNLSGDKETLHRVQQAWIEHQVPQCGYCQSGQIMAAASLLSSNPSPSDKDIDAVMSGNLCRCGTYTRIRAAIHAAAKMGA